MYSNAYVWSRVLSYLEQHSPSVAVATFFDDAEIVEINDGKLVVFSPSPFRKDVILNRYAELIKDAMREQFETEIELVVLDDEEYPQYSLGKKKRSFVECNSQYTFESFVVGATNQHAFSAAEAVAEERSKVYNPLFLYGQSGLGKTHLLYAIANRIQRRHPDYNIVYLTGEQFTNEFIEAVRSGKNFEFRDKYRNADLFLMDDIQFIAGKDQTQEEFFHTFNNIYEAGHQIVITSDRPPIDMSVLDDRLRSRFEGGLMADIQPPDLETRMVITRAKAAQLGLIIEDDAVNYIAETLSSNVRQIEGVVKRLTAYKEILGKKIDTADVKRAIADVTKNGSYIPSPQRIIHETARFFSLSEQDIRGQNRSKSTAFARQVSMYLIRTLTNLPLKEIGGEYEGRNHSTVLSSIKKIEDLIRTDKAVADTVRDITSNINSD